MCTPRSNPGSVPLAQRARRAAELAHLGGVHFTAYEEREMVDEKTHHRARPGRIDRGELVAFAQAEEVVVVGDLAAGLAAGIEARLVLRALAVQCEEPEAFARRERRGLAACARPARDH